MSPTRFAVPIFPWQWRGRLLLEGAGETCRKQWQREHQKPFPGFQRGEIVSLLHFICSFLNVAETFLSCETLARKIWLTGTKSAPARFHECIWTSIFIKYPPLLYTSNFTGVSPVTST